MTGPEITTYAAAWCGYRERAKALLRSFINVRRYAGGLSDWQAAGYPLEGTAAG